LAEIIKTVSGRSLRSFADSAIFKPLGMVNSQFQDNYAGIIKNRAPSYTVTRDNNFQQFSECLHGGRWRIILQYQ
jgi:CubicO group peptidase (beta-lactamase class C family)